jgi:hypothetical protein
LNTSLSSGWTPAQTTAAIAPHKAPLSVRGLPSAEIPEGGPTRQL